MYLTLDLSINNTGWCLFSKDKALLHCGVLDKADMLYHICELISNLKPDVIIIEDTHGGNNTNTTILLCKFQGVVSSMILSMGIRLILYSCNTARKNFFGQNANKQISQRYVMNFFTVPSNEHIIDAFILGMGYLFRNENLIRM